jgi:iron complex outermembrane recepter protein
MRAGSVFRSGVPVTVLLLAGLLPLTGHAQEPDTAELANLDIEQLAQIKVTSVARRPEALGQAPAAIFVITNDEIRRSGATSLPEALHLAPGLQVARVGSREWAISSRGFNERSSNKLLVLVDGRAVYTPVFAGVNWDVQEVPLMDIDRIEVILGPGATLWGSNAVNGVINVISRSAAWTRGGVAIATGGTAESFDGTLRYGAGLRPGVDLRVYGRYLRREPTDLAGGQSATDDWDLGLGGIRLDASSGARDKFSLLGRIYTGSGGDPLQLPSATPPYSTRFDDDIEVHGGSVIGRWSRQLTGTSDASLQIYYDRSVRTEAPFVGRTRVDLLDFDLQHHFQLGRRQDIVWGAGYRRNSDETTGAYVINFVPPGRATHLFTGFLQDDIALTPVQWRLTLGSKLEHNTFSGWELQPNVRLRWVPSARQTVWAAVSRAVRIPSRVDADLFERGAIQPGPAPVLITAVGNDDFQAEELIAYEVGYRATPTGRLSLDATLYYNDYDRLRTFNPLAVGTLEGFVNLPLTFRNDATGSTYGGTVAAAWRATRRVRVDANYTYLKMKIQTRPGVLAATSDTRPDFNPSHQAALRLGFDLPYHTEADLGLRYVSQIFSVSEYLQGDARLGWSPRPEVTLSLIGKDLFSPRHYEFASPSFVAELRQIPRRFLAQIRWQF